MEGKMNKLKFIAAFYVCLLAACGTKSDAKKAVLGKLKDPESAKFGKFTQVDDKRACFAVNARNSMGGYTGEQQAVLLKDDNGWSVLSFFDFSHEDCIEAMKRHANKEEESNQLHEALKLRFDATNSDVVIDTKTGLMWAKNSNIAGRKMNWKEAMTWVQNLKHSGMNDWRLPTKEEWEDLAKIGGNSGEWVSNMTRIGFTNIDSLANLYWSSSSHADIGSIACAWYITINVGYVAYTDKANDYYVWPVRARQ
jgi:hypothetical protein